MAEERAEPSLEEEFETLRTNADMAAERERIEPFLEAEPEKRLAFIAEMEMPEPEGEGPIVYACPMHPKVIQEEPGKCPECGMKLLAVETSFKCPMHPDVVSTEAGHCPECGMKLLPAQLVDEAEGQGHADSAHELNHAHEDDDGEHHAEGHDHEQAGGIEWEDDMVEVNRLTTPANMRWKLIDRDTGKENAEIDWRFRVGDQIKIRLLNEMAGDHPMHHPFHVHGAGRLPHPARATVKSSQTWSGRTQCLVPTARPSTSSWMSPIPAFGWPIAT